MDTYRAFLAIVISFVILVGYQYFFVGFDQPTAVDEPAGTGVATTQQPAAPAPTQMVTAVPQQPAAAPAAVEKYDRAARKVVVDTDLYSLVVSEDGGAITSFNLKKNRETNDKDSPGMQLVKTDGSQGFPLDFSWGSALGSRVLYDSKKEHIELSSTRTGGELRMVAETANGLSIERVYTFDNSSYLIDLAIKVKNNSGNALQGIPQLQQINTPFEGVASPANRFLFSGPATVIDETLEQIKFDDFEEGPKTVQGAIEWAGYDSNYFLCAIIPLDGAGNTFTMQGSEALTKMQLSGSLDTLPAGAEKEYKYHVYYGPKKLTMMDDIGFNLGKSVNFGWFDLLAKPTLWLLNKFYSVVHNYGIAIIMVTVLFKAIFWPITQKGMKSMKNMQKLQPKMAKIKEKYKGDPTRMNQEVMSMYKTYKVNPLGGCLPMVLQIPVFFALYKVLLQSIELRHAPFMLWISDLSAPDRLWIGLDLPYVGGLPVLTLLMGASMFLQQKMSPSTADPTQAKIMMFLPVVFTFMFLNFASGLVLYWFINNLLSILQQVIINRDKKTPAKAVKA
jgi:YidC/Oxa1 family membrane protein insertase